MVFSPGPALDVHQPNSFTSHLSNKFCGNLALHSYMSKNGIVSPLATPPYFTYTRATNFVVYPESDLSRMKDLSKEKLFDVLRFFVKTIYIGSERSFTSFRIKRTLCTSHGLARVP
jgi:hypothetical protein